VYRSLLGDFESPQAEAFYVNVLRRMTPEQKWQTAINLWEMAVEASRDNVRAEHPDWLEEQVRATVARRILEANGGAARLPTASV
jgi:16S rRNA C967 or C1407 C5-methylase (RsmB/RsmF family)